MAMSISLAQERLHTAILAALGSPIKVKIAKEWEGAGRTGKLLADVMANQAWAVVLWDDDSDEPELHKLASLELASE